MPDMYDQVWLFGVETSLHQFGYATRLAQPGRYPFDRLGDAELLALNEHMRNKGGVFATGDHGLLGRCLGDASTTAPISATLVQPTCRRPRETAQ